VVDIVTPNDGDNDDPESWKKHILEGRRKKSGNHKGNVNGQATNAEQARQAEGINGQAPELAGEKTQQEAEARERDETSIPGPKDNGMSRSGTVKPGTPIPGERTVKPGESDANPAVADGRK
jgi:hypothetical protein